MLEGEKKFIDEHRATLGIVTAKKEARRHELLYKIYQAETVDDLKEVLVRIVEGK